MPFVKCDEFFKFIRKIKTGTHKIEKLLYLIGLNYLKFKVHNKLTLNISLCCGDKKLSYSMLSDNLHICTFKY